MLLLQYIETLPLKMNQKLLKFYSDNVSLYEFEPVELYISTHINNMIKNADGSVKKAFQIIRKDWRRKKQRWLTTSKEDFNKKSTQKNIYSIIYENQKNLTKEEWSKVYDNLDTESVKNSYLKQIITWADDNDKYLYEFPLFHSFSTTNRKKAILRDLEYNILKIIISELGEDVNNCMKIKPEFLTKTPLFSEKKKKIKMQSSGDGNYEYSITNPDAGYELSITASSQIDTSDYIMKMLDAKDAEIINYIFNQIEQEFSISGAIRLQINNLARHLYPRANSRRYDEVKQRILNMVGKTITYKCDKRFVKFNLIDMISIEEDENEVRLILGHMLRTAYISNKVVYITKITYDLLENELSKHLCYVLQLERIRLSNAATENEIFQEVYHYTFFLQSVMFKNNNKKDIIDSIKESLKEFKEKKIIIKDFVLSKERFYIAYYPLTDNERADLKKFNLLGLDEKMKGDM